MSRRRAAVALAATVLASAPAAASAAPDPLRSQQWNLDAVSADVAHRASIGAGVVVAVIDSGVQALHPDFAGSVIDGPDFVERDAVPNDQHGHGTNVAGIIAARADNGIGIKGAAPGAQILAIRVLDANNTGTTDQQAAGINAAVDRGAQVINLSLNAGPNVATQLLPTSTLVQSIERAARAGVVVVASAGNDSVPLCAQPLLATKILCVGAVNRDLIRSSYSNYAVRVDVVAPGGERRAGEAIASAQLGGGYSAMAGTSQATPHVAAAAAVLVSLGLRGRAVIDRLEQTATPLGNAAQLGHGMLNMGAAVAGLAAPQQQAAPPAALVAKVPRRVRFSTLRRSGLLVTCTSPQAGRCSVRVTSRKGSLLARGSRSVAAGVATNVRARLTSSGRRTLRGAKRRVHVRVSADGAAPVRLTTTFAR